MDIASVLFTPKTVNMCLFYCFRNFPFEDMEKFQQLKSFEMSSTDIRLIPSYTPWPVEVENITLFSNGNLEIIEPFSFTKASNLKRINLIGSGYNQDKLTFKSNAFHTTSPLHKTLELISSTDVIFEPNTFGNVDGGVLWDILDIGTSLGDGFPEDAFRLLLKAHFDKGHKSELQNTELCTELCTDYLTYNLAYVLCIVFWPKLYLNKT